jgi:pyocin large subunit-like protein
MPKFRSVSGGHVRIYRQDNPSGLIDIDEGGSYETDDKGEIQALKDSTEVEEVKGSDGPSKDVFGDKQKARS